MYYTDPMFWFWMVVYGIVLTYIVWGIAFSFQALLLLNNVESAKRWVRKWYSLKSFKRELSVFNPMIKVFYVLFEYIPDLFFHDKIVKFNAKVIWEVASKVIIKEE